nr:TRAP transporter substrate-binding protein [Metabacillus idriensis]
MRKKKMLTGMISTIFAAGLLIGCSSQGTEKTTNSSNSGGKISIKLAHAASETHQNQIAADEFKKLVEEKSNGSIEVKVYPNAKLGSEKDAIEGILNGTIDMTTVAADSSLANVVPEMNLFGLPFLFKDREHVYSVLDGDIGKKLLQKVDEKGMKGLGFWEVGFRQMTTNDKPIVKPDDMKGLKMRVQPAPVWQEFMKSLGANPTAVNFNELYSALEQGIVDGQENPIPSIMSSRFYEVQKQVSITNHSYTAGPVLISKKLYDLITGEQKNGLRSQFRKQQHSSVKHLQKPRKSQLKS